MYDSEIVSVLTLKCTFLAFLVSHVSVAAVNGIVDYCAENTFDSNSSMLQFTKEMSTKEYALSSRFKSLHCCAKGYGSIEWFKDGKAYPWPAGVSTLILYPESTNQTIYAQTLGQSDAGNYSCLVSNDTHQFLHTVQLHVIDATEYSGTPLPTYEPLDQYVSLGSEARLFCEAFVGHIDLPDAHNEVTWRRGDVNASFARRRRFHETAESREDDQVLGSHLLISEMRREDYGQYVCRISNLPFQAAEFPVWLHTAAPWDGPIADRQAYKKTLLCLAALFLALLTLVALYLRFSLTLRRIIKDKFAEDEEGDGKEYDVLVCFNENDVQFVLGVLVPALESRYNYRCCVYQLPPQATSWLPELRERSDKSRRVLAVMSPSVLQDVWTNRSLSHALGLFLAVHPNVVCVTLQAVPKCESLKDVNGETLSQLLRRANAVPWTHDQWAKGGFWAALRLRLPPQRPPHHIADPTDPGASSGVKHRSNLASSSESLEVLV